MCWALCRRSVISCCKSRSWPPAWRIFRKRFAVFQWSFARWLHSGLRGCSLWQWRWNQQRMPRKLRERSCLPSRQTRWEWRMMTFSQPFWRQWGPSWNEFQLQVGRVSMMSPSNSNVKCTVLGTGEDFLPWPIQSIHVKDQPMGATNDLLLCFFKYDWLQPHLVPTSGIRI